MTENIHIILYTLSQEIPINQLNGQKKRTETNDCSYICFLNQNKEIVLYSKFKQTDNSCTDYLLFFLYLR